MSIIERKNLVSDLIDFECTVDGVPFPFLTGLEYQHTVDSARVIKASVSGIEPIALLTIGSKVVIKVGTNETTHNLDFVGLITEFSPSYSESKFTAVDYITELQTSELVEYVENDILGEDLYYLAANACDYREIDVSELKEGSGIKATKDMNLTGLMTRRQFIDKCFRYMVEVRDDNYHKSAVALQWRYAIRKNEVMDFWLEDPSNFTTRPLLTISDESNNLTGPGLIGNINSSTMVNSATYQSNKDTTLFATITDEDSVARHGIYGKVYQINTLRKDRLEELAYQTVLLHKEPTLSYKVVMSEAEHVTLGDYIRVKIPTLDKDIILPVVDVTHTFQESVSSSILLGTPNLSISQYIASLV
tara:strand:+ start:697 stop:1779 length:1083 start_codon:yes stop_codon:yes gene_type:complete